MRKPNFTRIELLPRAIQGTMPVKPVRVESNHTKSVDSQLAGQNGIPIPLKIDAATPEHESPVVCDIVREVEFSTIRHHQG